MIAFVVVPYLVFYRNLVAVETQTITMDDTNIFMVNIMSANYLLMVQMTATWHIVFREIVITVPSNKVIIC